MPDQPCSACGGQGSTFKTVYAYEVNEKGEPVPVQRQIYGQCSSCGDSGRIT
ncbi:hypothetical protein [Streptacidiphilus anmyonensis]|uniref:hypothetical protein n=1 Tax=Streptacidiphilus anmyonensis TaxID=405782 RepID=UPI000AA9F5D9|nr:hypothetical protein [Streptacidiphilus anmyonensis]